MGREVETPEEATEAERAEMRDLKKRFLIQPPHDPLASLVRFLGSIPPEELARIRAGINTLPTEAQVEERMALGDIDIEEVEATLRAFQKSQAERRSKGEEEINNEKPKG